MTSPSPAPEAGQARAARNKVDPLGVARKVLHSQVKDVRSAGAPILAREVLRLHERLAAVEAVLDADEHAFRSFTGETLVFASEVRAALNGPSS